MPFLSSSKHCRTQLVSYEEPASYNDFLGQLKDKLLQEKLGGDRQELWWLIRRNKLGLVTQRESDQSRVTDTEAKEVSLTKMKE